MEPIRKVVGPRSGIEGPAALHAVFPVGRDQREPDGDAPKRRRAPAAPPAEGGVHRDDDGHVHVDVRA